MPAWLILIVIFSGSFLGCFFASAFYVSKMEDESRKERGNGEGAN